MLYNHQQQQVINYKSTQSAHIDNIHVIQSSTTSSHQLQVHSVGSRRQHTCYTIINNNKSSTTSILSRLTQTTYMLYNHQQQQVINYKYTQSAHTDNIHVIQSSTTTSHQLQVHSVGSHRQHTCYTIINNNKSSTTSPLDYIPSDYFS